MIHASIINPDHPRIRINLLLLLTSFLLAWNAPDSFTKYELTGTAQGTRYHIRYYTTGYPVHPSSIDSLLNIIDGCFSLYQEHSVISQFNKQVRGLRIPPAFHKVMAQCFEVYEHTQGLADPTVLPLVRYWDASNSSTSRHRETTRVRSLLSCIGLKDIQVKGDSLIKRKPCLQLDLNGIAQGYTVDLLAAFLEQHQIHDYVVELGGEIRVKGTHKPSTEKFRVAIERPAEDLPSGNKASYLYLDHGAVTTSGNYRKYYESGGHLRSHIINPLSGYPVDNELISVTVIAETALIADAYDNALLAMGLDKGLQFVEAHPFLAAHFIYRNAAGGLSDTSSNKLKPLWIP